jgi:single-strand selective monofunctional uracil DNA glycosylase
LKSTKSVSSSAIAKKAATLAKRMRDRLLEIDFSESVPWVYHPLDYAWRSHAEYIARFGDGTKRVLFVGMNPGPWGMVQTGVPFGEVCAVTNWLRISDGVTSPKLIHPKRPIDGFLCKRSEVSGRRFWGVFQSVFQTPEKFFAEHFVVNYCPVAFMEETGRNVTPDKLAKPLRVVIEEICNDHLSGLIELFKPQWVVGVGGFAEKCAATCVRQLSERHVEDLPQIGKMLHPSPASPAANKDWESQAMRQMYDQKIWTKTRLGKT